MTGWQKVAALTALYVVALLWVNWTMLRRVKGAVAARAAWTAADFDAVFSDCDGRIAPVVRAVLEPWYGPGVVPRPEDTLRGFLKMDAGDVEDVVAAASARLGLLEEQPLPMSPDVPDVAALARHVDALTSAKVSASTT
jgi:hypothetical protein